MSYEETWAKAAEADSQITKHFDHWLTLARGLSGMRDHLRAKSGANSDASPIYRRAYAEWVPTRPWAAKWSSPKKSSFRAACYWLAANQAEVETWRASLDPRDRDRWQSPEVVMREYRKAKRPAKPVEEPTAKAETPTEALTRENAELKARIEAMRRGGDSQFDLDLTGPDQIARIIVEEAIRLGKFAKASRIRASLDREIKAAIKRGVAQAG
jgi:hypothetical protein